MSAHDSAKSTPHDMPQKWLHYGLMITGACQVASLSVWHRQVALVSTPCSQPENPELKQTLKGFPKAIKLSKVYRLKSTLQWLTYIYICQLRRNGPVPGRIESERWGFWKSGGEVSYDVRWCIGLSCGPTVVHTLELAGQEEGPNTLRVKFAILSDCHNMIDQAIGEHPPIEQTKM